MSLNPAVRVVLEGTGVVVTTLPSFATAPPVDSSVFLTLNGGAAVEYKVEKYETYIHVVSQSGEGFETVTGVECYAHMVVSEV